MKTRILAAAAALLLLTAIVAPTPVEAAGTITSTATNVGGNVTRYVLDWTCTAGGAVSGLDMSIIRGRIFQAEAIPDSGGTQPSDLYDLELQDPNNVDLLQDAGDNLSQTTSKLMLFDPPLFYDAVGSLELVIANGGASKGGQLILWIGP